MISGLFGLAGGSDGMNYPALTLYGHLGDPSSLFDVTEGANGFCDGEPEPACGEPFGGPPNAFFGVKVDCGASTSCNAAPGFDGPSGVGTPNGLGAFKPLFPTAAIAPLEEVKIGAATKFSGAGSTDPYPGGSIATYSWNWGDGTPNSTGVAPEHTFATLGTYTVKLTATDSYGLVSQSSQLPVTVVEETAKEIREAAEAKQKAEEAKKHEEEAKKHEEEATKRHEEEAKKHEEEVKKEAEAKAEEEAKKAREEAAAAARKREEEATAKKKQEEQLASSLGSGGVAGFQANTALPIPDALLASTTLKVGPAGIVTVKVSCPAGESNCIGTVTLRTLGAVLASASKKKAVLSLAAGSFTIPGGQVKTLKLHLSSKALALLVRSHSLRVRVTILAHDPAGATHTSQAVVLLGAPKAKRHG